MPGEGDLTKRQQGIIDALRAQEAAGGRPLSLRELQDATGTSSSSVISYNLAKLVEFGLIERDYKAARSIRLTMHPGEQCPRCQRIVPIESLATKLEQLATAQGLLDCDSPAREAWAELVAQARAGERSVA